MSERVEKGELTTLYAQKLQKAKCVRRGREKDKEREGREKTRREYREREEGKTRREETRRERGAFMWENNLENNLEVKEKTGRDGERERKDKEREGREKREREEGKRIERES